MPYPKCYCGVCGEDTGYVDDEEGNYTYFPSVGYVCEACLDDCLCTSCNGRGEVEMWVDENGNLDFVNGEPNGAYMTCQDCDGEGWDFRHVE